MQLPSLPASLWRDTASSPELHPPALTGDETCDIAVVGGGYTGLHAALAFADLGLNVVLLEAGSPGQGASGRNGGVVSAKFRRSFGDLAKSHGLDVARRMHAIANGSVDHLLATLERFDLKDAGFRQVGALKCAHSSRAYHHASEEAAWLRDILGETNLKTLGRDAVAEETGTKGFVGGVLQENAGTIQPLSYLMGLWRALSVLGVPVFAETPVTDIRDTGTGVRIRTQAGEVHARKALLATNAFQVSGKAGQRIARGLVPFRSAIIATEKLPPDLYRKLLKHERSYTETRRMMRWFRKSDGRILFGGRGALGHVEAPAAFDRLEKAMRAIFPSLDGMKVEYRWSGQVALSFDGLPIAGLVTDRIGYAGGFNGAGVAMSGFVGDQIARRMTDQPHDLSLIARASVPSMPLYQLRALMVRGAACGLELMDSAGL
ncbi:NAD(P)/FAD-dependent oxidoreductase [Roseibium aggregatum]|uniref:FAD-binding oxidoreductase n=1 Tax=Roseibium aggregatum TaxID=187304 RepID=A0A939EHA4_9HYPH|nr:FAD-binding oxidoreductase [Roseibium aggregatum]MBN9673009.1 FAD-binding oxidoreductase [Roseibium aggregatum]